MSSPQEVDVEMKHRLARTRTHVEHRPVSLLDVPPAGNLRRRQVTAPNHVGVFDLRFLQSRKMLLRNDEHVRRCFWVDVLKGKHMLVLVNFFGGDLAAHNAAEKAIARGVVHGSLTMAKTITHESTTRSRGSGETGNLNRKPSASSCSTTPYLRGKKR